MFKAAEETEGIPPRVFGEIIIPGDAIVNAVSMMTSYYKDKGKDKFSISITVHSEGMGINGCKSFDFTDHEQAQSEYQAVLELMTNQHPEGEHWTEGVK